MAVMHFLLGRRFELASVPENRVAYTGTHDNDTSAGWWASQEDSVRERAHDAAAAAGVDDDDPSWLLIGLALASPARTAIVPAQDLLSLGSDTRMNTPGREHGNWAWRLEPGQLDGALAARLAELTRRTSRLPARRSGGRSAPAPRRSSRTRRPGSSP
jgi:4-alpha-glucanotransferase